MAKQRPKRKTEPSFSEVIVGFATAIDVAFERLTGKPVAAWLKEFQQQPGELPPGKETAPQQPVMPLADAYSVLGLTPDAPLEQVKKHYRNLAKVFHSDSGNVMNDEAMKLLNKAHSRILKERGGS